MKLWLPSAEKRQWLTAVLALVDAGDEVILSDPGYSPYDSIVKIANAVPVYVPLNVKQITGILIWRSLSRASPLKTKLIMLCTPF